MIRFMRLDDIPAVMEIEKQAYPFPWTAGIFQDCLSVGYPGWVLEVHGEMVGYAMVSFGAGESHLLNLCVTPAEQGKGYASQLLDRVKAGVKKLGADKIILEVRESNQRAVELYRRTGFKEIGRRKNYYPAENGREDALVLCFDIEH